MTSTNAVVRPDPGTVGLRAATILEAIRTDDDFDRLAAAAGMQAHCYSTFNGYPIVANFHLYDDTEPLLDEAFKVLALKAAVLELSEGDERAAELMVPVAVDEMVHAVLVQQPLVVQLQHRLGIAFVHMTDHERFGWEAGDYTEDAYRAAGWGDPPGRYWVPAKEWMRRLGILDPVPQRRRPRLWQQRRDRLRHRHRRGGGPRRVQPVGGPLLGGTLHRRTAEVAVSVETLRAGLLAMAGVPLVYPPDLVLEIDPHQRLGPGASDPSDETPTSRSDDPAGDDERPGADDPRAWAVLTDPSRQGGGS